MKIEEDVPILHVFILNKNKLSIKLQKKLLIPKCVYFLFSNVFLISVKILNIYLYHLTLWKKYKTSKFLKKKKYIYIYTKFSLFTKRTRKYEHGSLMSNSKLNLIDLIHEIDNLDRLIIQDIPHDKLFFFRKA